MITLGPYIAFLLTRALNHPPLLRGKGPANCLSFQDIIIIIIACGIIDLLLTVGVYCQIVKVGPCIAKEF